MRSYPRESRPTPELRKPRVLNKRSAEERERLVALFERSGQSPKQFCRDNAVALSTLSFWRRQGRQSAQVRPAGVLVEVSTSATSVESLRRAATLSSGSVDIRLPNRVELSVPAGIDSAWLSELLRELLTCSG